MPDCLPRVLDRPGYNNRREKIDLTYAFVCISVRVMEMIYTQKQLEIANRLVDVLDSKFFKTLSEPVRVQILRFILLNGRADIGTIAENMPQDRSVISRHLNQMQAVGILNSEKVSRHVYYSINARTFLERFTNITELTQKCLEECGPDCCR